MENKVENKITLPPINNKHTVNLKNSEARTSKISISKTSTSKLKNSMTIDNILETSNEEPIQTLINLLIGLDNLLDCELKRVNTLENLERINNKEMRSLYYLQQQQNTQLEENKPSLSH